MPYKPPTYEPPNLAGRYPPLACSQCGAFVNDEHAHTSWHAALTRLLNLEGGQGT